MLWRVYTQEKRGEIFLKASLFVLTPLIPSDGDRDGIPNVLIEAMACAIPVVSTAVAGIPERDWCETVKWVPRPPHGDAGR